jgi:hypothetical protein
LLFNVAQAYRLRGRDGDCTRAIEHYRKFLELDPRSPQRAAAVGFITSLETCAARELAAARRPILGPSPAPGEPAPVAPQPPATPPVAATAAPAAAVPAPRPPGRAGDAPAGSGRGQRIAGIGVAAGGLALIATGAVFGARASSLADEVTSRCASGCAWTAVADTDQRGRTAGTVAWLGYGLGTAAVIAGGVIYVLGRRADAAPRIGLATHGDGVALTWGGAW